MSGIIANFLVNKKKFRTDLVRNFD